MINPIGWTDFLFRYADRQKLGLDKGPSHRYTDSVFKTFILHKCDDGCAVARSFRGDFFRDLPAGARQEKQSRRLSTLSRRLNAGHPVSRSARVLPLQRDALLDAVSGRFGGKKSGTAVADPAFVSYV